MNCYLHPETPATAFCRSCGRPLCAVCTRTVSGTVYCQDHAPAPVPHYPTGQAPGPDPAASGAPNPYFQPSPPLGVPRVQNSPGLAFVLGWIPGVGAIYNGQYLKGLVHAIIFGLLVSLLDSADNTSGAPFLGMMMTAFLFYMAFEAYHTAKKRQLGLPLEEWSSLVNRPVPSSRAPIGPILLIAIGVLFLLDTLHLIQFREIGRFWPVLLIGAGAYMLWARVSSTPAVPPSGQSYPSAADPSADTVLGSRHD